MGVKAPGLFICFDDHHVDEWYDYRSYFEDRNMKVTFYIGDLIRLMKREKAFDKLQSLRSQGHTIGCHGLNHIRAGFTIERTSCQTFIDCEISPWLELMRKEGFEDIRHYCYPMGNHTDQSDECLLEIFDTLRQGGRAVYTEEQIKNTRILRSPWYEKKPEVKNLHEGIIKNVIDQNMFFLLYMHRPSRQRLDYLSSFNKLNFLPMGVLDRERE